jgi:hypothetical protein
MCNLHTVYDESFLEDENDEEEHEEVYAEDYDDTNHCTQRKQVSLTNMHSYPTQ